MAYIDANGNIHSQPPLNRKPLNLTKPRPPMPTNPLPNPLPAGTVVWIPDNTLSGIRYNLTSPVHILDEGMVEAAKDAREALLQWKNHWPRVLNNFERAFAHVLVPPQETGKDAPKTCRERMDHFITDTEPTIKELVRCVYAQADAIDALRAEVKEAING